MRTTFIQSRRATILLAVMLVLVAACLIGGSVAARSIADVDGARFRLHEARARAAAWSGVLAAMVELESQRAELLAGGEPELTAAAVLSRASESPAVEVRLIELDDSGTLAAAQSRCLGINRASAEMLESSGVFGKEDAERIEARGAERPFTSVEEAMVLVGAVPAVIADASAPPVSAGAVSEAAARPDAERVLSAYSFDPEIMAGAGNGDLAGEARFAWTELIESGRDEASLAKDFGTEAAPIVAQLVSGKVTFGSRRDLVGALRRAGLNAAQWGVVLDRVRLGEDEFVAGRIDLSSAPPAVLACVPGIGPDRAAAISEARDRVSADSRRSLSWPVVEGLLAPDDFEKAVDHLTTRSAQFRVRAEGVVRARDGDDARPLARVVFDAVIDVSAEPARVAYLRDSTMAETALAAWARTRVAPAEAAPADGAGPVPSEEPRLDARAPRAENTGAGPAAATEQRAGSSPVHAHGRAGRWSPGPRSRGGG